MPRIAIVEDEAIVALDISRTLKRRGYSVSGIFDSGEELLAHLEERKTDLILLDVHLRGRLDGIETSLIIRDRFRVPVILLTAHAESDTIARATLSEPFAYILKPFEERELYAAIEVALYRAVMESKTRSSEEKYRQLFVDGLSAHFICDSEGCVLEANQAFRNLTAARGDTLSLNLSTLFNDPLDWERMLEALDASGVFPQTELRLHDIRNDLKTVLAQAVRIGDGEKNLGLMQGEFVDMTDRRRLEDSLMQAQKMDAVGRLAGGVAHDFNNILTAIIGYADMLAAETDLDPIASEDLQGIRTTAMKATGLTRQLLAFSRRQPSNPSVFDVNALVIDAEKMLRRLLTPEISLKLHAYADKAEVYADPGQIEQALLNLVVNARDAMPEGGTITVRTAMRLLEAPLDMGREQFLSARGYAVLSVSDTGPGIPVDRRSAVFQPFFTTKPEGKGTGLGLSIVDGIVRRAKGAVTVDIADSVSGKGAIFSIWIPLAPEPGISDRPPSGITNPVHAEESERPRLRSPMEGRKILIVDDDASIAELAARMLDRAGFVTIPVVNAGEAILVAEKEPTSIGLVIADMILPHIGGDALCARLSGMIPELSFILMSGHPDKIPDTDAFAVGRDGSRSHAIFLSKPFTEIQLVEAVYQILETSVGPA